MDNTVYCRYCGRQVARDAKFCRYCGAVREGRADAPSFNRIDSGSGGTKPAKKKSGMPAKAAVLLLVVFAAAGIIKFLSGMPFEPGGISGGAGTYAGGYVLSDVKITDEDLNVPAYSGFVSPGEPEITVGNVRIDFYSCNLRDTKEVKVKKLGQKRDGKTGFVIQAYDFELEGVSEFNTPVSVEMPYEPAAEDDLYEESTVFVQHYNKNDGRWELIPSRVNAEANTVSFLTNHFSTFGVFQDEDFEEAKKIARLFQYSGNYTGPLTPVYTTGTQIERYYQFVDEKIFQAYIDYKTLPVNDFASSFLNVMNHGSSSGEYFLTSVSPENFSAGIEKFNKAGKLFVFSKIAYQWYNGVALTDIITDNIFDLSEIAIASAGTLFAAPELTVIAAGVWLTGLAYDVSSAAYEYVSENEPRYLTYRLLSENGSVYYLPDEEICVYWKEISDPSYSRYDKDLAKSRNKSVELNGEYGWARAFNAIREKYKENPIEMTKAIQRLLESYLDVFWYHYDIGELNDYLKSTDSGIIFKSKLYDEWEWPSESEILRYKANYRQKMKETLRPVMKAMAQKSLLELNELTLKQVTDLWDFVNMPVDFQILDENLKQGEFFPSSPLSDMTIQLSKLSGEAIPGEWICGERRERSNSVFSCNIYAYIKAGCPVNMDFYEKNTETGISAIAFSGKFTLSNPTVVTVGKKTEDISGIYTGKAIGGNYVSGEEADLYYKALRIESGREGILIGPCLENGDYDPEYQVMCVFNDETKQYEGQVRRESGSQWTEIRFTAVIYDVYKNPRVKAGYTQTLSSRPGALYVYEYDAEKTSPLKGSPDVRTAGAAETPVPEGAGKPVGGF